MMNEKTAAEKAGAPSSGKARYDEAVRGEKKGEEEFKSGSFVAAKQSFEESGSLFRKSAEEAKATVAASANITELKTMVSAAREDMLTEKSAALKDGGQELAAGQFSQAQTLEREGDRGRTSEKREALQTARNAYLEAGDGFRKAREEAARLGPVKKDADAKSLAMSQAKQGLPGSEQERKANPKYRSAVEAENTSRSLYQSHDYAGARDGFARARSLYAEAGNDMRGAAANTNSSPPVAENKPPEKKEPVKNDPAKNEREERETSLRQTLESYKKSFEEGDIQTFAALRNLTPEAAKSSEAFFKSTDNRSLTINQVLLQPDLVHARAELLQKFHADADQTLPVEVILELVNGRWSITSFSRK
jgi:hypothetical protein